MKTRLPNSPVVMAIGDGANDTLMLQKSDISIEIQNLSSRNKISVGDIITNNLNILPNILMLEFKGIQANIYRTVYLLLYTSIMVFLATLYLNFLTQFTGT